MALTRTYGKIEFIKQQPENMGGKYPKFHMTEVEPHVCIKLKNVFEQLPEAGSDLFRFPYKDDTCHDLLWFIDRYPMAMDDETLRKLKAGRKRQLQKVREMHQILSGEYQCRDIAINQGYQAREYQSKAAEIFLRQKKMLLCDDLGLGKSLTAVLPMVMAPKQTLPALIVCQTHLPRQWKEDTIIKFTNLSAYMIPLGEAKKLPPVDVYICPYSRLAKWEPYLKKIVKYIVFDEVQELRCVSSSPYKEFSDKYGAAKMLCEKVNYVQGLSGSPIYNYAIEMFNILNCIKDGCVGSKYDWCREWGWKTVGDPHALGTYLREVFLYLRRTDKEVDRELPQLNTIITTVDYDDGAVEEEQNLAKQLAMGYLSSSIFSEKGQFGRQFDMRLRQITGVAKARGVVALVKILLENGKKVLLSGWHREVYSIWLDELKDFSPVMYTGSETTAQKDAAKEKFIKGQTNLFIISNRSGTGLDGLQYCGCYDVVIGELDWSPQVHKQIIARVRRDGQTEHVSVYYPLCDFGSDPTISEVLALKAEQQHAIIDPALDPVKQYTDENRIKKMAENYLRMNHIAIPEMAINEKGVLKEVEKNGDQS